MSGSKYGKEKAETSNRTCKQMNMYVVSGAGVVHYHLLYRPRSVPTALGPAPLATM